MDESLWKKISMYERFLSVSFMIVVSTFGNDRKGKSDLQKTIRKLELDKIIFKNWLNNQ